MFTPSAVVPEAVADSRLASVPVERARARCRHALSAASCLDVGPLRARVCWRVRMCVPYFLLSDYSKGQLYVLTP